MWDHYAMNTRIEIPRKNPENCIGYSVQRTELWNKESHMEGQVMVKPSVY